MVNTKDCETCGHSAVCSRKQLLKNVCEHVKHLRISEGQCYEADHVFGVSLENSKEIDIMVDCKEWTTSVRIREAR